MTQTAALPPEQKPSGSRGKTARKIGLALALGAIGGTAFALLGLPLPWLLGAMVVNTLAALFRLPIQGPTPARRYVVVVIGVLLGSSFTPAIVDQLAVWAVSLGFLALYLAVSGALVVPYYRKIAGFDPVTAYFAGMPGGLNEMMLIGKDLGGDERQIVLAHAGRIFIVVCLLAIWFRLFAGLELDANQRQQGISLLDIHYVELAFLVASGVIGYFLGTLLRLPAPTLIGPMIVSAIFHLAGWVEAAPPRELVLLAQIVMGTVIGCRFVGALPREIGRSLLFSLGASLIMLSVTLAFAVLFHGLFGQSVEQVLLAFAPGGLAEMSLVALALNADVAYVTTHHMVRIAIVILIAPLVFSVMRR